CGGTRSLARRRWGHPDGMRARPESAGHARRRQLQTKGGLMPASLTDSPPFHTLSVDDALAAERVDGRRGLSTDEAQRRRATFGPNKFAEARKEPWWHALLRQYADPMQIVLLVAGVGSLYPVKQFGTGILL